MPTFLAAMPASATRPRPQPTRRLLSVLGTGFGIAITVGNTIGAGILRTPGDVAALLPNRVAFVGLWVLGGVFVLTAATSISELGAMIPRSGGHFVFAREALGDYAGFVIGWSDWISTCAASAAVAIVVGEYTGDLLAPLHGHELLLACAVLVGFTVLQQPGVRWGDVVQRWTTLAKALGFMLLVAACIVFGGRAADTVAPAMPRGFALFSASVLALQAVIYTYDGWAGPIYFSEELRDPGRRVPRAMFGGVLSVAAVYVLVAIMLVYVLPISEIAGSRLVLGAAANRVWAEQGDTVVRVVTLVSMLAAINAFALMASRILFAMSRDRLIPAWTSDVNRGGSPVGALWVSAAVSVAFLASRTFENVIAVAAFFFMTNYIVDFVSVFLMRRRQPHRERPYRAWGFPWTTAVCLLVSVAFLIAAVVGDTRNSLVAVALLLVSYPVFRVMKRVVQGREIA
jgi:basic amino acid/polyamine antiporter, APA family